ncbi:helix-turn-helix domain-containing protein [Peptacetobacter hominis]|uniref:Helix-turn-helix domain-containing protein n=1 Tax=Peptacetobacter hominis TaxID=2743610 RepID=A0A544QX37_9FIRM|nr:helix-turn-helix domain-containing protein [Peptacetobacter hominis]TQQ85262.1 helix-turn-helix domain-containing protein [Peptacetobacter hominis]
MNNYITGTTIKTLREKQNMTQAQMAEKLCISDKTISKWETGRGLPDISMLESIADVLKVSIPELLTGETVTNTNVSANLMRSKIYVCPVCGNVLHSSGEAVISCCGINLPVLETEEIDDEHDINVELIEHEYYITIDHEMTKKHYISFIAYCTGNRFEYVKLYPEGNAEARFFKRGRGIVFWYCNHHGLFSKRV